MAEHESRLDDLATELWELRAEVASRRPVEQIVKYLLYFWLTLSILLGFFGWKQLSALDEQVKRAVASQFPEDSENYKNYKNLLAETEQLYESFETLTSAYRERVEDLKYADVVASDFDIEGQIMNVVFESEDPSNILDSAWRTRAITVLNKFSEALENKGFPATFVFNAAQVCRQLRQFQLAEEMTNAAFEKDPSAPIQALKLASEVANKTGPERDLAYSALVDMVAHLDYQSSPQIVLAEAWNAAEGIRSYEPLVKAIEELAASTKKERVPSYAYLIQAQAMLRIGYPGVREDALPVIEKGYAVYQQESSLSQWNESFATEYARVLAVATEQRELSEVEGPDVEQQLDFLRELLGTEVGDRD